MNVLFPVCSNKQKGLNSAMVFIFWLVGAGEKTLELVISARVSGMVVLLERVAREGS
jgi:hypothetical protein